ncbi:MAG: histidine--tRNA ligase [bacterium]|nr:histidine--tRNA ligase [bacterium]
MEKIKAVRGTKDILPHEVNKWQFLENKAREIFSLYGYKEIRTPIFEEISLFVRGIGQGTDIVRKEMYVFDDRKGRKLCLRPEGTAGVMRAFLEHNLADNSITKLFYTGPMFRYERPQAGRYRQHTQIGVEAIGSAEPSLDAEVISLVYNYFILAGLENIQVELNSVGCEKCRGKYKDILKEALAKNVTAFCPDCQERFNLNVLRMFDCKIPECQNFLNEAPKITDAICPDCQAHLAEVKAHLDLLKINYKMNPRLVRGLDYYTRTTFEIIFSSLGSQNAIAAGGRYDKLIHELGGDEIPGIGFAMGVERIVLALDSIGKKWPEMSSLEVYNIAVGSQKAYEYLFELTNKFRQSGISCEIDHRQRSLKSQLKTADKLKAKRVIILGDQELEKGIVLLRSMNTGVQREIKFEELFDLVKKEVLP